MKRWVGIITVVLFALGMAATASAADYKAVVQAFDGSRKAHALGIAGERWAELINQKTNAESSQQYPGTSLVAATRPRSTPPSARVPSTWPSVPPSTGPPR